MEICGIGKKNLVGVVVSFGIKWESRSVVTFLSAQICLCH